MPEVYWDEERLQGLVLRRTYSQRVQAQWPDPMVLLQARKGGIALTTASLLTPA